MTSVSLWFKLSVNGARLAIETTYEMATRKKKETTTAAPRKRTPRAKKIADEAQTVGADIVPSVTIEVDLPADPQTGVSVPHLSDWDFHLFNEGSHTRLWEKLGSHVATRDGVKGTTFAVWAQIGRAHV